MNNLKNVRNLIEQMNKKYEKICRYLIYFGDKKYGIIDMYNFGRVVKIGTLEYLRGFIDGIDYKI